MSIQFSDNERWLIAAIDKKLLDDDLLQMLVPAITEAVDRSPKSVILDITNVQFLPSLGIGTLVKLQTELKKRQQRLLIAGVHANIRKVLAITRLDKLFDLNDSLDAAVTKLQTPAAAE